MVKKYSKSEGADLGIHDFGYLCEGQLRDTRACVDLSSSSYWKICPSHICASRMLNVAQLPLPVKRAWASCFILGEHGLRFISFQLHLFFFPHLEVCLRQRLSAAVWEAVKYLGCSWSALTKWMPNFPLDFQKTQHSVKSGWVRFVFMTNFIFFLLLSFLFFNSERLPSSGVCLFFSKSKRLPSSGTCHFLF